ncbi:MAG: cytochrome c biogenesis protein CcdA [Thermoplasmatota archaeon]
MKIRWKKQIFMILAIFIISILVSTSLVNATKKAPDFTVSTAENSIFKLSNQEGKPVLIDFMTPLCSECKKLESNLKDIYDNYEKNVIFISIDVSNSSISRLKQYKEDRDIPWIVGSGNENIFVNKFKGNTVPKTVIIDEDGYLNFDKDGVVSKDELKNQLDQTISGENTRIDLKDYGIYTLAIFGGFASFFSPCAFPLLPSFIAYYITGKKEKSRSIKSGLTLGLKAAFGLVTIFGLIGFLAIGGSYWISQFIPYLELIVGILILILGLLLLKDIDIGGYFTLLKNKIKYMMGKKPSSSKTTTSPFLYGMGYGSAAAGCTAPVFIAIVLSSWLADGLYSALVVILIYFSIMAGLMIFFSVLTMVLKDTIADKIKKHIGLINKISASIMIAVGIYLITYFLQTI